MPSPLASHWQLPPDLTFLNHGSFGATPRRATEAQARWLARLERNPMQFYLRDLDALADEARAFVAALVHANADDLGWVGNVTEGVSTVLRSLEFLPGDEIVVTDHGYNACNQAAYYVAERCGARIVVAQVPFPIQSADQVTQAIERVLTRKTRLVMIDHITSPTALIFPVKEIVALCEGRGIETLVDGAHAPGQTPINLDGLGASYYVANCHKWLCAPKAVGFVHVRRDKQAKIRPLAISHGANSPRTDRSRFRLEFDWTGTADPTAMLCITESVATLIELAGGMNQLIARNHALAIQMRDHLCAKLGTTLSCPDTMTGSMATIALPDSAPGDISTIILPSALQLALAEQHKIEVPIIQFPTAPRRWVRVSAQLYNDLADAERLSLALAALL